jgi:hypothetical protein
MFQSDPVISQPESMKAAEVTWNLIEYQLPEGE